MLAVAVAVAVGVGVGVAVGVVVVVVVGVAVGVVVVKNDYSEAARRRAAELAPKATKRQVEYLEILLNDNGYSTRILRYDFLSGETGRQIRYLDDLTLDEASSIINGLAERRRDDNC
jgi:hypothetical protein